jgi:hypothetical protein
MKIGSVVYTTQQGLGILAKDFYNHGVIDSVILYDHPNAGKTNHRDWYPEGTIVINDRAIRGARIDEWIKTLDAVLFFETPFDWSFPDRCRELGLKTFIMPMYEWYPVNPPHLFDHFINPSLLDQMYFPHGTFVPIPPPSNTWRLRNYAMKFLHNAGNIGSRNHKGTLELLHAMKFVRSPIELTIRCQDIAGFNRLLKIVPETLMDSRISIVAEEIPYNQLFADHDVFVWPEKYNGLSLPLQEAFAAGMLVMSSNRFPMNTWLPNEPMIPVESTRQVKIYASQHTIEECIISPESIATQIDQWYGADIESYSMLGYEYGKKQDWGAFRTLMESLL